jgi:hypothetical protein
MLSAKPPIPSRAHNAPPLVSSSPFVALLKRYEGEIPVLRSWAGSALMAESLAQVVDDLARALREASDTDVFMSLEKAATAARIPLSTLRRRCSTLGSRIGATKHGKSWRVHWPALQQYLTTNPTLKEEQE